MEFSLPPGGKVGGGEETGVMLGRSVNREGGLSQPSKLSPPSTPFSEYVPVPGLYPTSPASCLSAHVLLHPYGGGEAQSLAAIPKSPLFLSQALWGTGERGENASRGECLLAGSSALFSSPLLLLLLLPSLSLSLCSAGGD